MASFENEEYNKILEGMDTQSDDSAKSALQRKLENDVRSRISENIHVWKFFGQIQTILNFLLPVTVCGYTVVFDWHNIIGTFEKLFT
ncbi:hypothetical protein CHH27_10760 [Labrenzia sp. VG12]|nr:hypothetical protein CHH27_10760 [Labrenzia sp. VG12]